MLPIWPRFFLHLGCFCLAYVLTERGLLPVLFSYNKCMSYYTESNVVHYSVDNGGDDDKPYYISIMTKCDGQCCAIMTKPIFQ